MPKYLIQVAYTQESWAKMVKSPQDRQKAVAPAVESVGGKFEHSYLAFGEYDLVGIVDMPDNVSMAALSISVASTGSVQDFVTTPLMTMDEAVEAMKKAGSVSYTPPK
jgi:uncharacterized protein with GYD domain